MKVVNFLNELIDAVAPMMASMSQDITVAIQPRVLDTRGIPYIDIAAPMYVHALHRPPMVEVRPVLTNLAGTQEISKKLIPCIQAHTRAARMREITLKTGSLKQSVIARAPASAADAMNSVSEPCISLLKSVRLCSAVTEDIASIENIGSTTDTRMDSLACVSKTSQYRVGNHDSIPSLKNPIAMIAKKIGISPLL